MRHLPVTVLFAALMSATSLACQRVPKVGRSPISVEVGVVRAGAVVETTVYIYWRAQANGRKVATKIPPSIELLAIDSSPDDKGREESHLTLALSTDQVGEHKTSIELTLGDRKASVPVTWTVAPSVPNGSRILAASTPFEAESSMLPAIFGTWRKLVAKAQLDIDYRQTRKDAPAFTAEALARVDIVFVGGSSLARITDEEVARLQGFVCGGGRVVLFADAFFGETTNAANRICKPFGLTMLNREPRIAEPYSTDDGDLPRHPLNVGVKKIVVDRPSPTKIDDAKLAKALVTLPVFGTELPFAAIATTKSGGELITVGSSLWWHWISAAPGNERLLRNLLVRAPRLR